MVTTSLPALPVYAANISKASNLDGYADSTASNASDLSVGEDTSQGISTKYKEFAVAPDDPVTQTYKTDVYVTQSTEFSVVAPVIAVMSGTKDKADNLYKGYVRYSVSGNIASDQAVIVEPDSSFKLAQSGKNDIDCTVTGVNNAKTSFTYADGLRKDNSLTSDYVLSTSDMTAGKWNGTYHTNISLSTEYVYYSSVERAANDANNLTNENADIARSNIENAEAALTFEDNKAKIMLFRNAEDVEEIDLTQDTTIDMNAKSINFASGKGFSTNNNLTLYDGTINATNPGTTATASTYALITNANPDATLTLNDCIINDEHTADTSKNTYEIYSKGYVNFDSATEINSTGAGNSNYFFASMFVLNPTVNNVKNAKINMTIDNAKSLRGIQTNAGEFNVNNLTLSMSLKNGYTYGIYQGSGGGNATVSNTTIDIDIGDSSTGSNCGLAFYENNEIEVKNSTIDISSDYAGANTIYGIYTYRFADVTLTKNNITVTENNVNANSKSNICVYLKSNTTGTRNANLSNNVISSNTKNGSNTKEYGIYAETKVAQLNSTNDTINATSKITNEYGIYSLAYRNIIDNLTSEFNINSSSQSYFLCLYNTGSPKTEIRNSHFTGENTGTGAFRCLDLHGTASAIENNYINFTANGGIDGIILSNTDNDIETAIINENEIHANTEDAPDDAESLAGTFAISSEANNNIIDNFHFYNDSIGASQFISLKKAQSIAKITNTSFEGKSTKEKLKGILFKGKQIDISNVDIDADVNSTAYGIQIVGTTEICNISNANIKITSAGRGDYIYGILDRAKQSTVINPNIDVKVTSENSACYTNGFYSYDGDSIEITNLISHIVSNKGFAAFIGNKDSKIYGCDIYADSLYSLGNSGLLIQSDTGTLTSTDEYPVKVYGKEWSFEYFCPGADNKYVINNGVFTSTCHPAYIGGTVEFNNSKFYIANRDKYKSELLDQPVGGIYCGTEECIGNEKLTLNNCEIGSPLESNKDAQHCIIDQRSRAYNDLESVDLNNCKLYGGTNSIFGFQTGFFMGDKNPIDYPSTTKINVNKGTELYVRDKSAGDNVYKEYTKEELANDVSRARKVIGITDTSIYNSTQVHSVGHVFFCEFVDPNGNITPLWTESANVYDNR